MKRLKDEKIRMSLRAVGEAIPVFVISPDNCQSNEVQNLSACNL